MEIDIKGNTISLVAYSKKTRNTYDIRERYDPYSYKFTRRQIAYTRSIVKQVLLQYPIVLEPIQMSHWPTKPATLS